MPFGWFSTNSRAASCATASRLGWTSVEHIDRETSRARMIDVRASGTLRTTCGPAGGQRERDEASEQQGDRQVPLPALPPRQHASAGARRSSSGPPACAGGAGSTSTRRGARGTTSSDRSASGQANDIVRSPARTTRSRAREPSARRSPPAAANSAVTSRGFLTRLELEVDRLVDPRRAPRRRSPGGTCRRWSGRSSSAGPRRAPSRR